MMRLDKYISHYFNISRQEAREAIKKEKVKVNNKIIKDSSFEINELKDMITYQDKNIQYEEYVYYLFNKPPGFVTSNNDYKYHYVMEYFQNLPYYKDLFPVGRLDLDSTGLLLITNDGALSHKLLSPNHHVNKTYEITTLEELTEEDINTLEKGIILDKKLTSPSTIKKVGAKCYHITISEGRYHQVKRMIDYAFNEFKVNNIFAGHNAANFLDGVPQLLSLILGKISRTTG